MILFNQLIKIGYALKPHGINGEITIVVEQDCELQSFSCLIFEIDGIYVPFFAENIRVKAKESYLVKFKGFDSEIEVSDLSNHNVFVLKDEIEVFSDESDEGMYAEDFIGYNICDENNVSIGEIIDFDDSTENALFIVQRSNDKICYIPIADDFFVDIDTKNKVLQMELPEGLMNL